MAKQDKVDRRTIAIHCARCRKLLYRYRKGGRGGLVKCIVSRIAEDHTHGDLKCSRCGQQFARPMSLPAEPALKIIQGKVYTKGMPRK